MVSGSLFLPLDLSTSFHPYRRQTRTRCICPDIKRGSSPSPFLFFFCSSMLHLSSPLSPPPHPLTASASFLSHSHNSSEKMSATFITPRPRVLIVGGGLGGLLLGAMLERCDIPYAIFERASIPKPLGIYTLFLSLPLSLYLIPHHLTSSLPKTLFVYVIGSAMSIGGQLAGVLKQLGIYEKFLLMGKPFVAVSYHRESGKSLMEMDYSQAEKLYVCSILFVFLSGRMLSSRRSPDICVLSISVFLLCPNSQNDETFHFFLCLTFNPSHVHSRCGDCNFIIPRPQLFELLLDLIPSHKIVFGKRVLNVFEEKDKIVIQTADNFTYEGDIVVGADGAYSAVRQRLYETLKKEGKLPKSDQEDLPFSCTCLVGQTAPLDVAEWPQLRDPNCTFFSTLGDDKPFAVSTIY